MPWNEFLPFVDDAVNACNGTTAMVGHSARKSMTHTHTRFDIFEMTFMNIIVTKESIAMYTKHSNSHHRSNIGICVIVIVLHFPRAHTPRRALLLHIFLSSSSYSSNVHTDDSIFFASHHEQARYKDTDTVCVYVAKAIPIAHNTHGAFTTILFRRNTSGAEQSTESHSLNPNGIYIKHLLVTEYFRRNELNNNIVCSTLESLSRCVCASECLLAFSIRIDAVRLHSWSIRTLYFPKIEGDRA